MVSQVIFVFMLNFTFCTKLICNWVLSFDYIEDKIIYLFILHVKIYFILILIDMYYFKFILLKIINKNVFLIRIKLILKLKS